MSNVTDLLQSEIINYKGEWQPNTIYEVGDYVYLQERVPGYFYKCIQKGRSQSVTQGRTGASEPDWKFQGNTYEGYLVWKAVERSSLPEGTKIVTWKPVTIFKVGTCVCYENGTVPSIPMTKKVIQEDGTVIEQEVDTEFVFILDSILIDHDWVKTPEEYQEDGTCTWQCYLSIGYYLPPNRLKEQTFWEFVVMMDYLILHEKVYFEDFYYKYKDLSKVRTDSIKEIIAEQGFRYISDILHLTRKEYETLAKYLAIINDLKGSLAGLEVVFNMIDISYKMTEWWEKDPQGTPHTFDLQIEVDIQKVANDMISKLKAFVRNYVYPVIENFEITYKMNITEMLIAMAGFIDIYLNSKINSAQMLSSMGGFYDKNFDFYAEITDCNQFIVTGGFIDIELYCIAEAHITMVTQAFGIAQTRVNMTTRRMLGS